MACQVPVVSSNGGGLAEINEHGITGYLANVGDVDAMAKYVMDIISDEETLYKFKANALAHAKKYDIDNIIPLYEKLYEKVVKKSNE